MSPMRSGRRKAPLTNARPGSSISGPSRPSANPVGHDPAVAELQPGGFGELGPRAHADGEQHEVGLHRRGAGDVHGAGNDRLDRCAEPQRDAELRQPVGDPLPGLLTETRRVDDVLVGDERHAQAAHGQRGGGLAADEARADDGGRVPLLGAGAQHARVVQRAEVEDAGILGARDGQALRVGAGGEHARVEGQRLAARQV
jgi:hypothetical protein